MTIDEIYEYCSDEDNNQITFDNSVFWLLERMPNFFRIVKEAIYGWDCDIDKYLTGETISVEFCNELYAVNIRFDTNTKTFIVDSL